MSIEFGRTGRAGNKGEAITLVSPNELRTIKRIEKDVGTTMICKVIPTRQEVKSKKDNNLLSKIAQTQITPSAIEMVKNLQYDLDIVTIAHLLASIVQQEVNVKGKDNIGFSKEEIDKLIVKAKRDRTKRNDRRGSSRRNSRGRNYGRRNNRRKSRN